MKFEDHDNAIAVLLRVLLEISIDIYITERSLSNVHQNDKLKLKFRKSIEHMVSAKSIDKKYAENLKRFESSEVLFSTNTLHAYIHSSDFFPSDQHLKTMWDNLEKFVVTCLKPKL
ncbi:MAG: hypothetical protein AAFR74_05040 [Pseudomonadota bacterium]